MGEILTVLLAGATGALISVTGTIIVNRLNRKDAVKDREKKEDSETVQMLKKILDKQNEIEERVDRNEIKRLRWEILDFANSCMNKRRHTKEEFDHIMEVHSEYESLLDGLGESNGKVDIAYGFIKDLYAQCIRENDFL